MKVLRMTLYTPDLEPIAMVVRAPDLTMPLEEAAETLSISPGAFTIVDIFEVADGIGIGPATEEAAIRQAERQDVESNMAILYYYDAKCLAVTMKGGVIASTQASPLSADEVVTTLKQLSHHPDYNGQMVSCHTNDGQLVRMENGTTEVVAT